MAKVAGESQISKSPFFLKKSILETRISQLHGSTLFTIPLSREKNSIGMKSFYSNTSNGFEFKKVA